MTEDQLRTKLGQKEEEIKQLNREAERLLKDLKEAEDWNKVFEDKIEALEDELKDLRRRDRIAETIIRKLDSATAGNISYVMRAICDDITDWEQAGMPRQRGQRPSTGPGQYDHQQQRRSSRCLP